MGSLSETLLLVTWPIPAHRLQVTSHYLSLAERLPVVGARGGVLGTGLGLSPLCLPYSQP